MITVLDLANFPSDARGGVLCVGNFDGVHAGHQQMLAAARHLADQHHVPLVVMTFDPHPAAVLFPERQQRSLMTLDQRSELIDQAGADVLVIVNTTRTFLAIAAEDFLRQIVRDVIGARHLVEGNNFTFGRGARGTVSLLQAMAADLDFDVTLVPTVTCSLEDSTIVNVSSSLIRFLINHGRMMDAQRCLTRPYTLRGTIVRGAQRGGSIGFPTANLQTTQLLAAAGVYAGWAEVDHERHAAAISIGTNPTFSGPAVTVEAFLLDFSGDLYGKTMDLAFTRYLRPQYKYAGVPQLVRQLERDVTATRLAESF